jgi:hypothetical protein
MTKKKEMKVTILNEASDEALKRAYQIIYKVFLRHLREQEERK